MRILGISGSLRRGSHNRQLLRAAAAALPPGVDLVEWDGLADLPAFDEDQEKAPAEPVRALLEEIASADALLIATPEYNASLPGALKNALDWASRPFPASVLRRKPSAVIGASTGPFGAVWAQAELRKTLTASGAHVVDAELPVGMAAGAFAPDGSLADPTLSARLHRLLGDLVRAGPTISEGASSPAKLATHRRGCTRPVIAAREVPDEGDCGERRGRGNGRDDAGGTARAGRGIERRRR
jgi:chromate reductase